MLSKNIKAARQAHGMSQEELAARLNVVRQTVSKWERGLSVPDADLLISLANELEMPVSALLGGVQVEENPEQGSSDGPSAGQTPPESSSHLIDVQRLADRLETINLQLAQRTKVRRRVLFGLCAAVGVVSLLAFIGIAVWGSPYLTWDFDDPELAVAGTLLHGFEWVFVRVAPLIVIASIVGCIMLWRRMR